MIQHCDRCNLPLPLLSGQPLPYGITHLHDDIGEISVVLCRRCRKDLDLFLADCPLVGDNSRATAT